MCCCIAFLKIFAPILSATTNKKKTKLIIFQAKNSAKSCHEYLKIFELCKMICIFYIFLLQETDQSVLDFADTSYQYITKNKNTTDTLTYKLLLAYV